MRLVLIILALHLVCGAQANKIIVGPDQPIRSFAKAVSLAKDGDTIVLKNGVYKEGNVVIRKSIVVIGEANTVLDGDNKHEIMTISARNAVVKNISFRNAGYSAMNDFAAIKVIDGVSVTI